MTLIEEDFRRAAAALGCTTAAIKAVAEVEAPRGGFNPDGTIVILFEGHKFSKFTKHAFDYSHPTISYPTWNRSFYGRNYEQENDRFALAYTLDARAAMLSTSWGKFQIMGFNHGMCGYATVEDFVDKMKQGEFRHLDAFVDYVISAGLADELRRLDWEGFARRYNGPGFAENRYDKRMASAYSKYSGAT